MTFWTSLRLLLLAIASLGYFANGAQAHVKITSGETLTLSICTTEHTRSTILELPGQPAEETSETCCGDCAAAIALQFVSPIALPFYFRLIEPRPATQPVRAWPRSPLWPGAPPQGPPMSRKT